MSGRLRPLRQEDLDDAQRRTYDTLTGGARGPASRLTGEDGGLVGPFNAMLHAPGPGQKVAELGEQLRFHTSIEDRLKEVAIITVGAHWKADFEWWAHARFARQAGVADETIDSIGRGERPSSAKDDEAVIHRFARALVTEGRVDDGLYREAQGILGEQGVVELVLLIGYYCLVSLTLNAFEVPVPGGAEMPWSRRPS